MSGFESEVLKVGQCFMFAIIDRLNNYVNYIKKCEENLTSLLDNLENLRAEKYDIENMVLSGKENAEKLTDKAALWLARVKDLVNDELMKTLMIKDIRIAKVMLRLMKNDLKKLVEDSSEMRDVVVKVMKNITKGKKKVDNREVDEKEIQVGQVLEKLMEETMEEFKKLMQNDEKMAIAAMHLLENHKEKLSKLTEKDKEVADIIAKARKTSHDAELLSDNHNDENVMKNNVLMNEKTLKENVKNILKPVGDLILSEALLKTLPENVRLGLEAMGVVVENRSGLRAELIDSDNAANYRNSCCCCVISYNFFSDRYDMSVAAEAMRVVIEKIIGNKPGSQDVTRPTRRGEMEGIPTNSVGLQSRNDLLGKIIKALASNDVHALGVFGMGGSGKTTLAKEVVNSKANGTFETTVMVEVSESPNIEWIQDQIADGLGLILHGVHGIPQKAIRIYNRLKPGDTEGEKDGNDSYNRLNSVEKSNAGKNDNNSKKILIVLDNIWNKIDVAEIGIPREHCKILLTSREKSVCTAMNVLEPNIFEVGLLNEDEAKDLFKFQVQREVHIGEYKSIVDRLLEKCRGLSLSIVATANSLKGKELPLWRQFVEELEKPISCQISGVHYETFSILRTSYEVMASEVKKKFFLLACLSPVGTSISIDNLMRYGIGLDLFQHVNKLSEAIDLARTWAKELVSSSMLLKGDSDEYVKIHDVVRESTMSFASRSGTGHMFLVDAVPRWICEETFNKYTGISLLAQANFAPLSGVKADLLQILLLKGNENHSSFLESNFFQGMTNLKVLEVLFMNFEKGLPESIGRLKVLKTLHLVECKLGDIKLIGELGSLLVLSLRGSSLEGLPDEIGKLYKLRLLDMSKCQCKEPRISANVIARLPLLEGLYLVDSSFTEWAITEGTSNDPGVCNGADIQDLTKLDFLNVLEIHMRGVIYLPICDQFVKNLDKFQIIVGQEGFKLPPSQRALIVSEVDVSQELEKDNCLKALLKKADFLALKSTIVKNIVPELDKEGYRDLSCLKLSNIDSISRICEGKAPTELFYNLCHLEVSKLENLEELFPVNPLPHKLIALQISDCNSLIYIFSGDDEVNKESDIIELPCLKTLVLDEVSNLISVVKQSNNDDRGHPSFFNSKVTLTSLEELSLKNNKRIVKLWDKDSNLQSFQNLKVLEIRDCEEMETIGPPSMFLSLVQLESLTIEHCKKMEQVISNGSETQEIPKESIMFPNLKRLEMWSMNNLECFYGGSYKMAFPRLETLIEFPCLKQLYLKVSDEVMLLWELQEGEGQGISSNPLPNIRELDVGKIKLPSINFQSLSLLGVRPLVGDAKFILSSSENEGCVGTYSQFPKLEELRIPGCPNSVQQFIEDDGSAAILKFCGQLRGLILHSALNMEVTSLHPFKCLRQLSIKDLTWEYLFSANGGFEQLQSLEELRIYECPNLEVIIRGGDKDNTVVFPRLKELYLSNLESMSKLCSISDIPFHLPSLEFLHIESCNKLESLFCGDSNQVVELPVLEYMPIIACYAMTSFSTRPLKAPKLRGLKVSDCPKMEWFLLGNSNCNPDLELPSLETVIIKKCPNMKSFSPADLRAPRLRELYVAECDEWELLFGGEPNQVVELPSLEKVDIGECHVMKYFSTRPLKAPKLRELTVRDCPKMVWFLLGNSNCNADLEMPSLENVSIKKCPNMKSFSPAVLRAPKLQLVKVDGKPYPIAEIEDFNHALQSANGGE
ncbi:uncharacterized protein LOC141590635 [Silene latifolia]|uniref:uncharacterized protein LOC141590635 n=1 Tax=Silene latifolia TaxID=37657 RepID=UPI003D773D3B